MKAKLLLLLLVFSVAFLATTLVAYGQDGGNIDYVKPDSLTEEHLGKRVHLDHGTRSFAFADYRGKKRDLSQIEVDVDGKKVVFREHRVDDGYNNWFEKQYMTSDKRIGKYNLHLVYGTLTAIDKTTIEVVSYFSYRDKDGIELKDRSFTKSLKFTKSALSEILIESN